MDMIITWHGGGCYRLQTPDLSVIIDSESSPVGNRLKGDLPIKTSVSLPLDMANIEGIASPGEYEISGVFVKGTEISAESSDKSIKIAYRLVFDGIRMGFMGNVSSELSNEELEVLSDIDILFIPSNSAGLSAAKFLEPKIVIPGWGDSAKISSELGQKPDSLEKLVIKARDIESMENMRLVILSS